MVALGIEVLLSQQQDLLRSKRVGLVSNYTATNSRFQPVIDLLLDGDSWRLVKLFGPEHGVKNAAKEGEHVASEMDDHSGLPVYSLYGELHKPTPEMLTGLDVMVIDLPDIGTRYYTNMNTLAYCLEACASVGIPVIVADRPNPIGGVVREGNLPDPAFYSFVGMYPIPNRHGLTLGELAQLHNDGLNSRADLMVVRAEGWSRQQMLPDTGLPFVPSSPNTNSLEMCLLYPGTCLFEGTNLSVGRGTAHPFTVIGAPYVDGHQWAQVFNEAELPGVRARPLYFIPSYSTHQGELCGGVQLHVTDRHVLQSVRIGLVLLQTAFSLFKEFELLPPQGGGPWFLDLLAGTDRLRHLVSQGNAEAYLGDSRSAVEQFTHTVQPYLLYGQE